MLMYDQTTIEDIFKEMLQVLVREKLLSSERKKYSEELFRRTIIQIREDISYQQSACIIPKPVLIHERLMLDKVVLRIGYHSNPDYQKYIIYHELAHLISIGVIRQDHFQTYVLPWGICKTIYSIRNKDIFSSVDRSNYTLNEKMNECLACLLYLVLNNKSPDKRILDKRGMVAQYDQWKIIEAYINHNNIFTDGCSL